MCHKLNQIFKNKLRFYQSILFIIQFRSIVMHAILQKYLYFLCVEKISVRPIQNNTYVRCAEITIFIYIYLSIYLNNTNLRKPKFYSILNICIYAQVWNFDENVLCTSEHFSQLTNEGIKYFLQRYTAFALKKQ